MGYTVGAAVVYWAAYGTQKSPHLGLWQWRVPIILQIFFPFIVIGAMFWAPESPRWLVERGRVDEARIAISRLRAPELVDQEIEDICLAVQYERESQKGSEKWYAPCESPPNLTVPSGGVAQSLTSLRYHSFSRKISTPSNVRCALYQCRSTSMRKWDASVLFDFDLSGVKGLGG